MGQLATEKKINQRKNQSSNFSNNWGVEWWVGACFHSFTMQRAKRNLGTCCGLKFFSDACFIPAERLWSNFGAEDELQDSEEPPERNQVAQKKNKKTKQQHKN